jgi:hypothetical protein
MAKNQKQKFNDDLNKLLDKYPNMRASDMILVTQGWINCIYRALPDLKPGDKSCRPFIREGKDRYRLG